MQLLFFVTYFLTTVEYIVYNVWDDDYESRSLCISIV